MPLYEYQCDACEHRFEVIQKYSDAPIDVCPKCGGVVRKLLSSPAIQFKGSGWYITDYARAGKTDGTDKSEKSEKTDTATVASGKNDSGGSSGSDTKSENASKSESAAGAKAGAKPTAPTSTSD